MEDLNIQPVSGFAYASGDQTQILAAATSPAKNYIHSWTMSVSGSATAMLFEYGTGSRALDILEGRGGVGDKHSNQTLNYPFGVGAGSSVYLTVDGVAQASAVVYYSSRS